MQQQLKSSFKQIKGLFCKRFTCVNYSWAWCFYKRNLSVRLGRPSCVMKPLQNALAY
jgi:hypothetical protein